VSNTPDTVLFFGHLHPLLVHLPIGLVVVVAFLELVARSTRFRNANANVGFILALTVPAAAAAAICGLLLSEAGGYQDKLLQWHKWSGLATALSCAVAGILYRLDLKKLYRMWLFPTMTLLVIAGHFGGSLTHGSDYFVRYAPGPLRRLLAGGSKPVVAPQTNRVEVAALPAFSGIVQPVLQQNCVSCHGPEKSKGGLRLDSLEAVVKGGKSGPVIVAGKSTESDLIKRIRLPLTDDDHMPPNGKPQPANDDLALLQWWIDSGAPTNANVGQLKPTPKIAQILAAKFGLPKPEEKSIDPKPLNEVLAQTANLMDDQNVAITPLSPKEPWLQCNASVAGTNFGDKELSKLAAIGPNLRWLDLGGTAITDAGLAQLSSMPNLTRLHLERTRISDGALSKIAPLRQLEYLNLYGTEITDAGLDELQAIPKLKQLYLWQTKVTPAAGKAFAEAHTDQDQLQRWQEEIQQLTAKIRDAHIAVDLGTMTPPVASTNATPVNAQCPVSGKPIDPTKTVFYEGKLIAFCCDDCKAEFQKDPKPYLAKLDSKPSEAVSK